MPPTLDELLPLDHPARFVAEFVDALDRDGWAELGVDIDGDALGAPAYHPRALLSVWLYGFMTGVRSCNPEYDRLYAQLEQTQIGSEREALVKQLHDMDVQDYYGIPLVNRGFVSAHLNTLKGVRINGWDGEMWNIAEWRR